MLTLAMIIIAGLVIGAWVILSIDTHTLMARNKAVGSVVGGLNDEIATLKTKKEELLSRISLLEATVAEKTAVISSNAVDYINLKIQHSQSLSDYAELQKDLETAEKTIQEQSDVIKSLQENYHAAQVEVNKLKNKDLQAKSQSDQKLSRIRKLINSFNSEA